jgi:hypothetical protein
MKVFDFIRKYDLNNKDQIEKATFLSFFHYKENQITSFTMQQINDFFVNAGFNAPNVSRLKDNLTKGKRKIFTISLSFIPAKLQELEYSIGSDWQNNEFIESSSELLDETKFCGKRGYLDKLIKQINFTYNGNCFDACSVLLRRVFEITLIHSYEKLNIENEIKNNNEYIGLDSIVKNAINNRILNLSRIKNEFDNLRKVGNLSAHGATYTASKKDIDDIKISYRVMLEELYNKSGLVT